MSEQRREVPIVPPPPLTQEVTTTVCDGCGVPMFPGLEDERRSYAMAIPEGWWRLRRSLGEAVDAVHGTLDICPTCAKDAVLTIGRLGCQLAGREG